LVVLVLLVVSFTDPLRLTHPQDPPQKTTIVISRECEPRKARKSMEVEDPDSIGEAMQRMSRWFLPRFSVFSVVRTVYQRLHTSRQAAGRSIIGHH
jgi:hypothetical protein